MTVQELINDLLKMAQSDPSVASKSVQVLAHKPYYNEPIFCDIVDKEVEDNYLYLLG